MQAFGSARNVCSRGNACSCTRAWQQLFDSCAVQQCSRCDRKADIVSNGELKIAQPCAEYTANIIFNENHCKKTGGFGLSFGVAWFACRANTSLQHERGRSLRMAMILCFLRRFAASIVVRKIVVLANWWPHNPLMLCVWCFIQGAQLL